MYRVIIADDENKIRVGLKALIHWEQLQLQLIGECVNGNELKDVLKTLCVDIILTDMQMPGLCGDELLRYLKEQYPYISVIVISGYDDFKYTKQAIVSNAVNYILKPVDEDELNDALKMAQLKVRENRNRLTNDGEWLYPELLKYFHAINEKEKGLEQTRKKKLVQNIKRYLDENYCKHISLDDLENQFYSNKEYISRVFKNSYGVTISDYIDHLRIRKANNLLWEGEQVKEICYILGFYDESHFYKKYKRIMGIAPSEYNSTIERTWKK